MTVAATICAVAILAAACNVAVKWRKLHRARGDYIDLLEAAVQERDEMIRGRNEQLYQMLPAAHSADLLAPGIYPTRDLSGCIINLAAAHTLQADAAARDWQGFIAELPTTQEAER